MVCKILLGDHLERTNVFAHDLWGDQCVLLTKDNHQNLLKNRDTKDLFLYTGLGDWCGRPGQLFDILVTADEVVIAPFMLDVPLDPWNPCTTDAGIVSVMALILDKFHGGQQFINQSDFKLTHAARCQHKKPKRNEKTLWAFGCSMTHGSGVPEQQRWANRLAEQLNLPLVVVAEPGSSVSWAADQIMRSDVTEGDIVVWGVTEHHRFPWYVDDQVYHVGKWGIPSKKELPYLSKDMIKKLCISDHLLHSSIFVMHQVDNFCSKINLLMVGLLTSDAVNLQMSGNKNFVPYFRVDKRFIDFGSDSEHPGPQEHSLMAKFISHKLQQLNYV